MTNQHEELGDRFASKHITEQIVDFVCSTKFEDLDPHTVERTKSFLMDTLSVGLAGRCADGSSRIIKAAELWGSGEAARVIGQEGKRYPAPTAAFLNGYHCHCLEWDCLHERAVVIAMCVPVAALAAEAEQTPVDGKTFLTALALSVEIASMLGDQSETAPRFFRPAVSGLMGAALGVGYMRGYNRDQMMELIGLAYSQASGTMQAHWEGAMVLAAQVGVGARAAIYAADMAKAGIRAPQDVILGKFGFFKLFETADTIDEGLKGLGNPWKVTELAHKPYPAGRATQSVLTMFDEMRAKADFNAADIEKVTVRVPPLIMLLVGRPLEPVMTASYARLCLKVIGPTYLFEGRIDPRKLPEDVILSAQIRDLGERFDIGLNDVSDPNALGPQSCEILLKNGERLTADCAAPYGAIDNPLDQAARHRKVHECFEVASASGAEAFIETAETSDTLSDIRILLEHVYV